MNNAEKSVSGGPGHGAVVDRDGIDSTFFPTRLLRLAVEVLLDALTPSMSTPAIDSALWDLRVRLADEEMAALHMFGLSRRYLVIRPVNPANLPSHDDLDKITAAIRTLAQMGLITAEGFNDDTPRVRVSDPADG